MAKVGRRSHFDTAMQSRIVELITAGCVIKDVCNKVGISQATFYRWQQENSEFQEAVTRALGDANINAAVVLRRAMAPRDVTSETVKTFRETRLRRNEKGEQVPYTYERVENTDTTTHELGDWRAALEYLRRRDPENWTEHLIIKLTDEQASVLKKAGLKPDDAFSQFVEMIRAEQEAQALEQQQHNPD